MELNNHQSGGDTEAPYIVRKVLIRLVLVIGNEANARQDP